MKEYTKQEVKKNQQQTKQLQVDSETNEGISLLPPALQFKNDGNSSNAPIQMTPGEEDKSKSDHNVDTNRLEKESADTTTESNEQVYEQLKVKLIEISVKEENNHMHKFVEEYLKTNTIKSLVEKGSLDLSEDVVANAQKLYGAIMKDFINNDDYSSYHLFGGDMKGKKKASEYYGKHNYHKLSYIGNWKNRDKGDGMRPGWGMNEDEKTAKDKKKAKKDWIARIKKEGIKDYKKAIADEAIVKQSVNKFKKILIERRANQGDTALLTKDEYKMDKNIVQDFLTDENNNKEVNGKKLFNEAADSFIEMQKQADSDGIKLKLAAAHRHFKNKGSDNKNAKADFSVHHLRNAIDLKLNVGKKKYGTETSTTTMNDVRDKRSSPVHKWMVVHGERHGWYPFTQEPWHWEYNPPGFQLKFKAKLAEYILANADSKLNLGEEVSSDISGIKEEKIDKKGDTEKLLRLQLAYILKDLESSEDQAIKDKLERISSEETTDEEKLVLLQELLAGITAEKQSEESSGEPELTVEPEKKEEF